jgi:signal peptidase II
MKTRYKLFVFFLSTILFLSCDRVTKDLAKTHLMNKPTVSYLHNTVQLMYVENTGAAMSFGDDLSKTTGRWLLGILPLFFLIGLTAYTVRQAKEMRTMKVLSFALIISGGLGNIIDRLLFDRHVTDFMVIGTSSIRTGVFNFADVCVSAGAIGLMLFYRDRNTQSKIIT